MFKQKYYLLLHKIIELYKKIKNRLTFEIICDIIIKSSEMMTRKYVPVAQLDRVTGYEPVGQGFESLQARFKETNYKFVSFLFFRINFRYKKRVILITRFFIKSSDFIDNFFIYRKRFKKRTCKIISLK